MYGVQWNMIYSIFGEIAFLIHFIAKVKSGAACHVKNWDTSGFAHGCIYVNVYTICFALRTQSYYPPFYERDSTSRKEQMSRRDRRIRTRKVKTTRRTTEKEIIRTMTFLTKRSVSNRVKIQDKLFSLPSAVARKRTSSCLMFSRSSTWESYRMLEYSSSYIS